MSLPDDIGDDLLALAAVPLAHDELADALSEICRIATRSLSAADGATMTTFDASGPHAAASSSTWAEQLDEMQYDEREGPCIDAARSGLLFRVRDAGRDQRWPSYMPRACSSGVGSMMSIPMTVEAKTIGALNIYSRQVDAFGTDDVSVAEVIAGHASLAMQVAATLHGQRNLAVQLREAMDSRAAIEQAKGIIMASVGCDADGAFDRLVKQSQHENRKVREVAEELIRRQAR